MFFGRLRAPRGADADASMGAGADADIFAVAPVDEIVPAFRAGPRMVGNLVGGQAVRLGDFLRRIEQRAPRSSSGVTSLPARCSRSKIVSGSMVSW